MLVRVGNARIAQNLFLLALHCADAEIDVQLFDDLSLNKRGRLKNIEGRLSMSHVVKGLMDRSLKPTVIPMRSMSIEVVHEIPYHAGEENMWRACIVSLLYLALISVSYGRTEKALYLVSLIEKYQGKLRGAFRKRNCLPLYQDLKYWVLMLCLKAVVAISFGELRLAESYVGCAECELDAMGKAEPKETETTLIMLTKALLLGGSGQFKEARMKIRKGVTSLNHLKLETFEIFSYLSLGWYLFLNGRCMEANNIVDKGCKRCDSTKRSHMHGYFLLLQMTHKMMTGEFSKVEILAETIRRLRDHEYYPAGVSAILSLSLVLQRKFD